MDNRNHENKSDSRMMWGMMILCLLPLALLFFSIKLEPPYSWIIFILAAIFMFGHHLGFLIRKTPRFLDGNGISQDNSDKQHGLHESKTGQDSRKKHGGCCH